MNDDEEKALVRTAMEAMKKAHEALIADAVALEKEAARKRALAAEMQSGLRIGHESATIPSEMQTESESAGRSLAQINDEHKAHKFVAMLERRKISVGDVNQTLEKRLKRKVSRSAIQAWYRDPADIYYRPTPEDAALVLRDEYAVPLSAWHRIRKPKAK